MASSEPAGDSAAARQRGNDFYRKGQFAQAAKAYTEAARLAPEDPSPWSNMSAIKFELGDYAAALDNLDKALALSSGEPNDGPKKQKLYTRMAKCHLHALALDEAVTAAQHLGDDDASKILCLAVADAQKLWMTLPDEASLRKQVFDRLPRYKSQIQDVPEYYAVGHDTVESLLDPELKAAVNAGGDVAFLMCGRGDARHLFATILQLMNWEMTEGKTVGKAHFTLVDINAAALARTLVMFDMLFVYIALKSQNLPRIEDAMTVVAFIYSSPFIPAFAETKVLESIRTLIDELEKDKDEPATNVLDMLWVPKATRDQVLHKLKQWAEPLGEGYTTKKLREPNTQRFMRSEIQMTMAMGIPAPKDSNQNKKDFRAFGVVFPNKVFLERRDPELLPLLEAYRKKGSGAAAKQALAAHIDANWRINMTMLDMDYEPRRLLEDTPYTSSLDLLPALDWDPNSLSEWLLLGDNSNNPKSDGLLEDIGTWFEIVAFGALKHLGRLQIELIAGEMADVMERIRYDSLEHRSPSAKAPTPRARPVDPSRFPRVYDRIHMSNIPDYIGGPLTAHMYGGPLLRSDRPSNLRFNNLLNPPMFANHDQFLAEYVLMHDERQLADHFGLARQKQPKTPGQNDMLDQLMKSAMGAQYGLAVEDYFIWTPAGPKRVPRARLMSRPALEHWLHAHLLKICLPYSRPVVSDRPVHAPLNLTAFLRLVAMLHGVGYPAHWLSGVLEAAATGAITTTARPPRRLVLTVDDLNRSYPPRRISLGPWKAEFTTLLSLWRRLLGFGVVAPGLPPASSVVECAVTFPEYPHEAGRVPHFVVAFLKNSAVASLGSVDLPEMIQDDEQGDVSQGAKAFREAGCHLVTTFTYVTDMRTATFWMREDVVAEMMRDKEWSVCMCRTDVWDLLRESRAPVSVVLRSLGAWTR